MYVYFGVYWHRLPVFMSFLKAAVATRLRSLRTDDSPSKGHSMRTKSRRSNWHVLNAFLLNVLTPGLDAVSLRGVLPWYQHSLVSMAVRRSITTQSQQAHRSVMTWLAPADSTTFHGAYTGFDVMLSAIATDSDNIVNLESEKKLLCVKCGLRTKFCTQSRTPSTSSSGTATRSRLIINFSP